MPGSRARAAVVAVVAMAGLWLCAAESARAAELLYADGRREHVEDLRFGKDGRWTYQRDGRRVAPPPGEVAAIVGDDGKTTETIPPLATDADPPAAAAALARVLDPKHEAWLVDADVLAARRSRALLDAMVEASSHKDKALRQRAVAVLVRMRTRESVAAAAKAVLAEKDVAARREGASALFASQEVLRRAGAAETLRAGVAEADKSVRISFALLAVDGAGGDADAAALDVLRKDGLGSSDHHTRESAAVALARHKDASGEKTLVGMLARSKLPGADGSDAATMERLLVQEQIEVCRLLHGLHTDKGRAALESASRSALPAVRAAAAKLLESW